MPYCPICRKHFTPKEDEPQHVCMGCYSPDGEEKTKKAKPSKKAEPEQKIEPEGEPDSPWVVYYLSDDGPKELARFKNKDEAKEYATKIYRGEVEKWKMFKGSGKIRVWQAAIITSRGSIVLPRSIIGLENGQQ